MTIGSPQIVLKLADTDTSNLGSTGASVVNSGTLGSDYVVKGTSTTRASSNGLWTGTGRLSGSSNSNGAQTWVAPPAVTGPGTGLRCISAAIAFKLNGLNDSGAKLVTPQSANTDGNLNITCDADGSGFSLSVEFRHSGGAGTTIIKFGSDGVGGAALSFGTVYQLVCSLDANTASAVVPRAKLNSGSVQTQSSSNFTSFSMEDGWPRLLHRQDFAGTGGFGFDGDLYYFAELVDATNFWDATDQDSINSDPTVLWGGGGGSSSTVTPGIGSVTIQGRVPSTSAFQNVRIREVLVNGSGQAVGGATGINLLVWYDGYPHGAPDLSLTGMTTDSSGTTSWSIATGPLSLNHPIFYVATSGDISPTAYTCARLTPSYE